jgi:hypothetical protein
MWIPSVATHDGVPRRTVKKVGREREIGEQKLEAAVDAPLRLDDLVFSIMIDLPQPRMRRNTAGRSRAMIVRPCVATASIARGSRSSVFPKSPKMTWRILATSSPFTSFT